MSTALLSMWRTVRTPGLKVFIGLVISGKALNSLIWLVQKCTTTLVQKCTKFEDFKVFEQNTLVQKCTTIISIKIPGYKNVQQLNILPYIYTFI